MRFLKRIFGPILDQLKEEYLPPPDVTRTRVWQEEVDFSGGVDAVIKIERLEFDYGGVWSDTHYISHVWVRSPKGVVMERLNERYITPIIDKIEEAYDVVEQHRNR